MLPYSYMVAAARQPIAPAAQIGFCAPTFEWHVEAGKIAEFMRATLAPAASGEKRTSAPPTFPQVATNFWDRPDARGGLGEPLDPTRLLHGEQEYEYVRPIRVGEILIGQTCLADYYVKPGRRGGQMRFAIYETSFRDKSGGLVAKARVTLIETSRPTPDE